MKPNTLCSRLQCPHVQKKVTRVPARMVKHDKMPSRGAPPVPCLHAGAPLQTAGALYIYIYFFWAQTLRHPLSATVKKLFFKKYFYFFFYFYFPQLHAIHLPLLCQLVVFPARLT